MKTKPAFIAGSARTPFAKSMTVYANVTRQELMIASLQALVNKFNLSNQILGDVALGAVIQSSYEWDFARECVLGTTLDPHTPAYNLQRACGTSLEAVSQIALKIANNQIDVGIAGGVDTNSDMPILVQKSYAKKLLKLYYSKNLSEKLAILASLRLSDFKPQFPAIVEPRTHLSMGEHCEKMVKEWHINREEQDRLALKSHQNGILAFGNGFYDDLVIEFMGIKKDPILRSDTSLEKLAKLKTVFDLSNTGTLTAGNSSLLSDGSASVLLVSEDYAKTNNHSLLARFVDAQVAAVDFVHGEGLLMGPTIAVNKLLLKHHLNLQDFDFYEIHEAFAGQVLCTLKAWESDDYCKKVLKRDHALGPIDRNKMNIAGGSVALGHPYAATGARIVGTLAKILAQHKPATGLISICTAGGMGIAAIMESV